MVISLLGYGIIGFLDDGIKLYFKRNLGLRAWQKLALQIIIAIVIVMIAASDHFQFGLYIPFAGVVHSVVLFIISLFSGWLVSQTLLTCQMDLMV